MLLLCFRVDSSHLGFPIIQLTRQCPDFCIHGGKRMIESLLPGSFIRQVTLHALQLGTKGLCLLLELGAFRACCRVT